MISKQSIRVHARGWRERHHYCRNPPRKWRLLGDILCVGEKLVQQCRQVTTFPMTSYLNFRRLLQFASPGTKVWLDALSINHADHTDVARQVAVMGDIYSNEVLKRSHDSLPHVRTSEGWWVTLILNWKATTWTLQLILPMRRRSYWCREQLSLSNDLRNALCLAPSHTARVLIDASLPPARTCPDPSAHPLGCSCSLVWMDAWRDTSGATMLSNTVAANSHRLQGSLGSEQEYLPGVPGGQRYTWGLN